MKTRVSRGRLLIAAAVLAIGVAVAVPASADDLGKLFKKTESGKSKSDDKPSPSKSDGRSAPSVSPGNDSDDNDLFRKRGNNRPAPAPTRQPSNNPSPTAPGNRPQPSGRDSQPPAGPGEYWVYPPEVETPFGNRPRPSSNGMINLARRTGEWQPKIYFPPVNDQYRRHYPRGVAYGFLCACVRTVPRLSVGVRVLSHDARVHLYRAHRGDRAAGVRGSAGVHLPRELLSGAQPALAAGRDHRRYPARMAIQQSLT
jgi:hypothetical protein